MGSLRLAPCRALHGRNGRSWLGLCWLADCALSTGVFPITLAIALQLPDEIFLKPFTGLPNTSYPSDHLALVVGFRFKKTDAFTTGLPWDKVATEGDAAAAAEEEDEEVKVRSSTLGWLHVEVTYFVAAV